MLAFHVGAIDIEVTHHGAHTPRWRMRVDGDNAGPSVNQRHRAPLSWVTFNFMGLPATSTEADIHNVSVSS
jgi:hypothetical protein